MLNFSFNLQKASNLKIIDVTFSKGYHVDLSSKLLSYIFCSLKIFLLFLWPQLYLKVIEGKKSLLKNFAECYTLVLICRGKHP
jgi:hypothetical protein